MTQEIQNLILESLKDFKSDINGIIYFIGGVLAIINIVIGFFIHYRIEKYKHRNNERLTRLSNNLIIISKKSEIKYKDHFDSQITVIKELYRKYVDLNYYTKILLKEKFISSPHDELKTRITNWHHHMIGIYIFYNRNRIIFSERIRTKFGNHIVYFEKIKKVLDSELESLVALEKACEGNRQHMYKNDDEYAHQFEDNEESEIIHTIRDIKSKDEFKNLDSTFNSFKKLLEKEYKHITT